MKLSVNGKLRFAAQVAFATGLGALATTAFAQESTESGDDAVKLDAIQVTGTRIKSQTMTATSPVMEIESEEFTYSGATLVEDLVNQYPQLSPTFDNFQNNPSLGYAEVDLRGLGAQRTLTLVNGRRIPKGLGETADISIVPAALIKRVDVLTGGASAVYGSDAIAGVVNFVLDDEFEGVSITGGYSAYQHDNDNGYIQDLLDARGFDYPSGGSGFDGESRSASIAIGGTFGERGHATGWITWRKNDPLFQGERDYSSCALNTTQTGCGGSGTADPANFYIYSSPDGFETINYAGYAAPVDGTWVDFGGARPYTYNYAPVNYYQRPEERYTAGTNLSYEINEHAKPYLQAMFVDRSSSTQLAPSGAFFTDVTMPCTQDVIGSLCSDLGIDPSEDLFIYVAKRNTEGGNRIYQTDSANYSLTSGVGGALVGNWSYDASFTFNRVTTSIEGYNDFLTSRIQDALLGCPDGSFSGCIPYDVWTDSITSEQAAALQGTSMQKYITEMKVLSAYVTGDLGVGLPTAMGETISLVAGYEQRREEFSYTADTNLADGNFAGSGSENPPLSGGIKVNDYFAEAQVPLLAGMGPLSHLDLSLGYRYSDYDISGGVNTYKAELGASFLNDKVLLRGGYNRAIRGPGVTELFLPQQIGLWSGADPCAGADPTFTEAQCALTGVPDGRYGSVPANAAEQYNQITGGNPELDPEKAKTWTFGVATTPIKNLNLSLDYYSIELSDRIGTVSAPVILDICGNTGNQDYCSLIHRNPTSGDLYRTNDGYIQNALGNFGSIKTSGLDLTASYGLQLGPGRLTTSFVGTYVMEKEFTPIAGDKTTAYDCAGIISPQCQDFDWRHLATVRYKYDRYTGGFRWRYFGKLDYKDPTTGDALTADARVADKGGIDGYSYLDLTGSVEVGPAILTAGVNNVFDKEPPMVGASLVLNGNSVGGYDQAGRFFFTSLNLKF